ncbi:MULTISPECIES: ABC transporter permease subunit [Streptomyces]|uniref:ABC transporter permease subunit n=1 Tax=Streptomyces edwardsiae TaxID=3075527 RepID=A0ABU2PQL1_9ACTN|nr:ABC transporter permease subunit [Streptomyces sp. DSM 41636]MDT0393620.1 ABC transporter permease subunit [Streptomyces sp. DSM 41636]
MKARSSVVPSYVRPTPRRLAGLPSSGWTVVLVATALVAIDGYARSGAVSRLDLVPVGEMAIRAVEMLAEPDFVVDALLRSVLLICVSFAASAVLGVTVAYAMARWRWVHRAVKPYVDVFYALPIFALYPVMVVMFGTGVVPIILLSTLFSVVIVISHALVGFETTPAIVTKLARSLEMSRTQQLRKILMPSALPDILVGLKLGLAYAIIAVLATEFILATTGLGQVVNRAYNNFNTVDMYAGIVFVSAFALLANLALGAALRAFDWRRR